jgi:hypothetical protein
MDINNRYAFWRWMGVDKVTAARLDRTETVEELEKLDPELYDAPTDYDVRHAIINSRKNLILIGHELDEISTLARSVRRWLIAIAVILVAILLTRL